MKYPPFLPKNGTIGICAPSFGIAIEPYITRYNSAKKRFLSLGYKIKESKNIHTFLASKEIRAKEFVDMWIDPSIDILFSVAGGEYMNEILPFIDFEELKKHHLKYFIGYSDNTNLTLLLTTHLDVATIYAQCFPPFGMEPWDCSLNDMYMLLKGEKLVFNSYDKYEIDSEKRLTPTSPYNKTEKVKWKVVGAKDIKLSGQIIGGCLDVMLLHLGTKYDLMKEFMNKYDDVILFLESYDIDSIGLRRAIWQLREAGWFDKCKAIVFGRPVKYEDNNYEEVYNSIDIPVIYDVDIGHLPPTIPIINGAMVEITIKDDIGKMEFILS